MTTKRRLLAFLAIAATVFASGAVLVLVNTTPSTQTGGRTAAARAVATATASVEAQGSPEALVAAFDRGEVTSTASVGDETFDADTAFYIGSLSKTFTAVVAARLVDQDRIDLNERVVTYLPSFRTRSGDYQQITVRHLLNQTSGLPTWAGMTDLTRPDTSLAERVRELETVDLETRPGTTYHYCNKNFALLARVIEKVTSKSYADVLRREVLEPLQLRRTYLDPADVDGRDVSKGNLVLFGAHLPAETEHYPAALADGYVISTARDLARFADTLATGSVDGRDYLSAKTLHQLHEPPRGVAPDPEYGTTYGLGVRVDRVHGQRALWHEGELATAHANLGVLPRSGSGLLVLTTHNGQMFAGDAPFLAGMDALTADREPAGAADSSYRATAIAMTGLAALVIAAIAIDLSRWSRILRTGRPRRAVRSALPRLLTAGALWVLVFGGFGAMLGLPGMLPIAVAWQGSTDLTAIVLTAVGYLVLSAVLLSVGGHAGPRQDEQS